MGNKELLSISVKQSNRHKLEQVSTMVEAGDEVLEDLVVQYYSRHVARGCCRVFGGRGCPV